MKPPPTMVFCQCGICTRLNICSFYEHSTNLKLLHFLSHTERKATNRYHQNKLGS